MIDGKEKSTLKLVVNENTKILGTKITTAAQVTAMLSLRRLLGRMRMVVAASLVVVPKV